MTHSDEPTTAEEREQRLAWMDRMDAKAIIVDRAFERRLIADVARLDRQLGDELAADSVLCPHAPQHVLEEKLKALEPLAYRCEAHQDEVAGCPCCDAVRIAELEAREACPQCPHCHPDSRWP